MHNLSTAAVVLGELDVIGPDIAHGERSWCLRHLALMPAAGEPVAGWMLPGVEYVLTHDPERLAWQVRAAGWPSMPHYLVAGSANAREVHLAPRSEIGAPTVHELDRAHAYLARPRKGGGWDLVQL